MPIRNEHETFYTLIVGLISLIRLHPDIDDDIVRQVRHRRCIWTNICDGAPTRVISAGKQHITAVQCPEGHRAAPAGWRKTTSGEESTGKRVATVTFDGFQHPFLAVGRLRFRHGRRHQHTQRTVLG